MTPLEIDTFVFERSSQQIRQGGWILAGGVGFMCLGLFGLVIALVSRIDDIALHSMSTVPMTMGVLLAMSGWVLSRGPRRVVVTGQSLTIEEASRTRQLLWSDLGWANVGTLVGGQKSITIYDKNGRTFASLSQTLSDFDDLVAAVMSRAKQQPQIASGIQSKKSRRNSLLMAGFAVFMLFAAGFIAWETRENLRGTKLLASDGIDGEGIIDSLEIAPNGVTKRINYTVKNAAGASGSRNVEIEPAYYDELQRTQVTTIPVTYVEQEPGISRLKQGEVIDHDFAKTPAGGFGLATGGLILSLFFLASAALMWNGWDIDLDSKTGKITIKRYGEAAKP